MTTSNIKSARIIQAISLESVPQGEYEGTWSGYKAIAIIHGEMFDFETVDGIRGIDVKCIISVSEDSITIEAKR